jgi:hypothetical protein
VRCCLLSNGLTFWQKFVKGSNALPGTPMDPWGYSKSAGIASQLAIFRLVLSNLGVGQG